MKIFRSLRMIVYIFSYITCINAVWTHIFNLQYFIVNNLQDGEALKRLFNLTVTMQILALFLENWQSVTGRLRLAVWICVLESGGRVEPTWNIFSNLKFVYAYDVRM